MDTREHLQNLCRKTHCQEYGGFPYLECRDGWKSILVEAIKGINKLGVPWVAHQIKEKFGTLRFYASVMETEEAWIRKVSKPGYKMSEFDKTLMKFVNKTDAERKELYDKFYALISEAESKSCRVCEECGSDKAKTRDLSWIQTLCNDCYEKVR